MKIVSVLILLLSSIATIGIAQVPNKDSLMRIASDESLSLEERQKAGKVLVEIQRRDLAKYFANNQKELDSFNALKDSQELYIQKLDSLIEDLTEIVLEEQYEEMVRKEAIDLLVKIDTRNSQEFLIKHLTDIHFAIQDGGADDELQAYYVFYSLANEAEDKWALIPLIFASLNTKKVEYEILLVTALLNQIVKDSDMVKAISNGYLKDATAFKRHNILQIINLL